LFAAEKALGKAPNALLNKPRLLPYLQWYYDAFWMLSDSRTVTNGRIGRISLGEMQAYVRLFSVDGLEARHTFVTMIRALDSVFVSTINGKIQDKIAHEEEVQKTEQAVKK
jgi:hypothetical protein